MTTLGPYALGSGFGLAELAGMNKSGEPVILDPRDALAARDLALDPSFRRTVSAEVSKCQVVMAPPKARASNLHRFFLFLQLRQSGVCYEQC